MAGLQSEPAAGSSTGDETPVILICSICRQELTSPASIEDAGEKKSTREIYVPVCTSGGNQECREGGFATTGANTGETTKSVGLSEMVATRCGHLYHTNCLEKWFSSNDKRTCPCCRKKVPKSKMVRLYPDTACGAFQCKCVELQIAHNGLINKYSNLQARYNEIRENDMIKEKTIKSLLLENAIHLASINLLKQKCQGTAPPSNEPRSMDNGNERRRKDVTRKCCIT